MRNAVIIVMNLIGCLTRQTLRKVTVLIVNLTWIEAEQVHSKFPSMVSWYLHQDGSISSFI